MKQILLSSTIFSKKGRRNKFASLLQIIHICTMISKRRLKINWDVIGISVSLFCAVHCLLLPVLITSLPFLGIEILENKRFEVFVLLFSLIAGFLALRSGYKKHHQLKWIPIIFLLGFLILIASNFLPISSRTEGLLKMIALPMVVAAHIFNWYYARHCRVSNM